MQTTISPIGVSSDNFRPLQDQRSTLLVRRTEGRQLRHTQHLVAINDLFHDIAMHSRRMDTRERLRMLHLSQKRARSISRIYMIGAVASLAQPLFEWGLKNALGAACNTLLPLQWQGDVSLQPWTRTGGRRLIEFLKYAFKNCTSKSCDRIIEGAQSSFLNYHQILQKEHEIWQQAAQERNVKVLEDLRSLHQKLEQALQAESSIAMRSMS